MREKCVETNRRLSRSASGVLGLRRASDAAASMVLAPSGSSLRPVHGRKLRPLSARVAFGRVAKWPPSRAPAREPARFERAPAQPRPARGQDHSRSGQKHRPIARARPPPDPSRQRCARAGRDVSQPVAPAWCCRRQVNEPRPRRASRSDDQEAVEARDRRPLRAGRQDLLERKALLGAGPRTTRPPPNTPFEPRPKRPPAPSRRASAASQRAQRAAREPMLQHVQLPPRTTPPASPRPDPSITLVGPPRGGGRILRSDRPLGRRSRPGRGGGAPCVGPALLPLACLLSRSCWLLHASSGGRRLGAARRGASSGERPMRSWLAMAQVEARVSPRESAARCGAAARGGVCVCCADRAPRRAGREQGVIVDAGASVSEGWDVIARRVRGFIVTLRSVPHGACESRYLLMLATGCRGV
jgi:hypothetical protein